MCNVINTYLKEHEIHWQTCVSICTVGDKGTMARVIANAKTLVAVFFFGKHLQLMLQTSMTNLLDGAIKVVNHIITRHILKYFGNIILSAIILVPH
jgi:hypothetical protein